MVAIHAIENKGLLSSVFERETMELPWTGLELVTTRFLGQ